jgi:transcription initiation factor TFIIB
MKAAETKSAQFVTEDKCPECGGKNLIHDYDTGETICGDCGLVVNSVEIDEGKEWRAFTQDEMESRSRVGMPSSYSIHDKGLPTTISQVGRDAHGRKLPLSTRFKMWRLRRWQIRSGAYSSIDRNLSLAMTELDRLSDALSIPETVKEKAAVIYRKALEKGLVRGRSIAGIVAASLYAACRSARTPRDLREFSAKSLVDRKELSRDYRLIIRELEIRMPVSDPTTYLTKIAEKIGLSSQILGDALKVLQDAKAKGVLAGKDPTGLAAAALYIASLDAGAKITQKEISQAAGITEVTVRNRFKNLKKQLNLEFD